jgi:hypothetical protein
MGLTQITTGGVDDNISIDSNTLKIDGTNNRVGIGTASPTHTLHLSGSSGTQLKVQTSAASAYINLVNSGASGGYVGYQSDNLTLWTGSTERFRVDSAGRVGIGNTTMSSFTGNASDNLVVGSGSGGEGITVYSATNNQGSLTFADGTSGDAAYRGAVEYNHTNDRLAFRTAGTGNRMVLDSSGRLYLGTTTAGFANGDDLNIATTGHTGITIRSGTTSTGNIFFADGTSGTEEYRGIIRYDHDTDAMPFFTAASEQMRIDSSGNVAIGSTSAPDKLNVGSTSNGFIAIRILTSDTGNGEVRFGDASNGSAGYIRYAHNGNHLIFARDGTEAMRISSGGNVGIGDSSPGHKLVVKDAGATNTSNYLNVISGNAANAGIAFGDTDTDLVAGVLYNHTDNALRFFRNGFTEAARISSNGNVGINTTSSSNKLRVHEGSDTPNVVIVTGADESSEFLALGVDSGVPCVTAGGVSSTDAALAFRTSDNGTESERMRIDNEGRVLIKTTSTINAKTYADDLVIGSVSGDNGMTIVSGTSGAGSINFSDGTGGASLKGLIQYDHAGNYMRFYTDETERVRITHDGYFLSGTTHTSPGDANTNTGFSVQSNGKIYVSCAADGGHINRNNTGYVLHTRNNGNHVGGLYVTSSATSLQTSSDYRLKENVVDLSGAIARVKQLAPKRFNFIIEPGTTVDGFLAHEAQTVVPEAVVGTHNEVDDNGDPVYQGIDPSKLIPLLTAALKEAIAKIETLETKVAALEAAE